MELGSLIGFIGGIVIVVIGMLTSTDNISELAIFADAASMLIVFGGTLAVLLISYPLAQVLNGLKAIRLIFSVPKNDPESAIKNIIDLANLARREGILALEEKTNSMDDAFLKKGIMLIVDGTDPELVRSILETEITYIEARHAQVRGFWIDMSSFGPAWGMIGTVMGLILMLGNMDPDTLGSKMAVALITTFYGSVISNFISLPVANKLKYYDTDETLIKEVLIEGMLSIQAGENPRIIEEKLKSFFAPNVRENIESGRGEA